jgi:hypothetical protein
MKNRDLFLTVLEATFISPWQKIEGQDSMGERKRGERN